MALIPPFFLDCVVAIGVPGEAEQIAWTASGFLYGHPFCHPTSGQKMYSVCLVTNRHVFEKHGHAFLRFNPSDERPAQTYDLDLVDTGGRPLWWGDDDPEVDIAAIPVDIDMLVANGIQVAYFQGDVHAANTAQMSALGVSEGDFAYVLGFPMGLVGRERSVAIVRSGSLARVRDTLAGRDTTFLVDALIFPGNSGGPVISKPELLAIQGTQAHPSAHLIGIVTGYRTYSDVAVSPQSKRVRVVFEDNSGLAVAHPMDFVQRILVKHICVPAEGTDEVKA